MRAVCKPIRDLVRLAESQNWIVTAAGSGHLMFKPRDREQRPVSIPKTPSDWRSIRNSKAQLRRAGLDIPRK